METKRYAQGSFEVRLAAFTRALGWGVVVFVAILVVAYGFVMALKGGLFPWPIWARPDSLDVWWLLVGAAEKVGWVLFAAWVVCRLWLKFL